MAKTKLELTGHEHTLIYVNGRLVAECAVGQAQDRDSLEAEVRRARALRALSRMVRGLPAEMRRIPNIGDHVNSTPAAKQQAFARGLLDGMDRRTVDHPEPGVPPMKPEHTRSYEAGYSVGEAIARAVTAATEGEEEADRCS